MDHNISRLYTYERLYKRLKLDVNIPRTLQTKFWKTMGVGHRLELATTKKMSLGQFSVKA